MSETHDAQPDPKPFAGHSEALLHGPLGVWATIPVVGRGTVEVLAESLEVASRIASLAFHGCAIGKAGLSKHRPRPGEEVIRQCAAPECAPDPARSTQKDRDEFERRAGLNYERGTY